MLVLGRVEQLADDAIVKVDDFIGDGGHAFDGQRYQRGIASLHLELCQISRRHLATFTSDFEQAVLVNLPLDACGQIKCLPGFQALNMFEHVARVRFGRRLAQPCQPGRFAVVPTLEQIVEAAAMRVRQRFGQGIVDAPVGAGDCFGARPLDGVEGRQNDRLLPQVLDQGAGQHDALVGLQGHLGQQLDGLPVVAHGKGLEAEHRLQLDQVLPPCLFALAVLAPTFHWHLELRGHHAQQGRKRRLIDGHCCK
ncbi:Uncharacterised protein [Klebsiella pneumoniae]|nr:Uncharacterised protein [Klebsiella pneumoniae]SWG12108.1 Uncharacterised protein [Klebsiella pneumoniae]